MATLVVNPHFSNYMADGKANKNDSLTTIHPYDSGGIVIAKSPGTGTKKATDGTPQRASAMTATGQAVTTGSPGNALNSTLGKNVAPIAPAGSAPADGLSQSPEHE